MVEDSSNAEGTAWSVPAGKLQAAITKLINRLGNQGERVVKELSTNDWFLSQVAWFMAHCGYYPTFVHRKAQAIMGEKNFFGPEEAYDYMGMGWTYGADNLKELEVFPYSEEALQECKDTHILVAIPRISLLGFACKCRATRGEEAEKLFPWYDELYRNNRDYAKEVVPAGWYLVRKGLLLGTAGKTWTEQLALIPKDEALPKAVVLVYAIMTHYFATGERLFPDVLTRSEGMGDLGPNIGFFDARGLALKHHLFQEEPDTGHWIGIATYRKQFLKK